MADESSNAEAGAEFTALVTLDEVDVVSGEEEEAVIFKMRCKLYCFVKEDVYGGERRENFWKERGTGDVKLLKHKTHGKVRLLMRQEKTLKICANHLVSPQVELQSNVGSDKSWVFTSSDFADEEVKTETFAIKFGSSEKAQTFFDAVEEAKAINGGGAEGDAADGAAEAAPTEDASEGDVDELIEARNKSALKRRDSLRLQSAQADSDHDSDEEDVDEGTAERLKSTHGDHTEEESAGINLAQGLAQLKVGGASVKDAADTDVKAAADVAVEALKGLGIEVAALVKIAEASSQVVAGTNFNLLLHLSHPTTAEVNVYSVRVFRPLPHTGNPMKLVQHEHRGTA